jgi:hypothetical protein
MCFVGLALASGVDREEGEEGERERGIERGLARAAWEGVWV